ncbi:MAG: hypothetical protein NC336_01555 [Clostridium sp.]|nr:hypothetical protein [Clostridium sp.]
MKLFRKPLAWVASLAVATFALTSCNSDDDTPSRATILSFATVESNFTTYATFLYQSGPNSPEYILTSDRGFESSSVVSGDRMVILYNTPNDSLPTSNTRIELLAAAKTEGTPIRTVDIAADSIGELLTYGVYVQSMSRTGKYINIITRLQSTGSAPFYRLMLDEKTAMDEIPQLYFVALNQPFTSMAASDYYLSYNIESLLDRSTVTGVDIHVRNENLGTNTVFTFMKDGTTKINGQVQNQ